MTQHSQSSIQEKRPHFRAILLPIPDFSFSCGSVILTPFGIVPSVTICTSQHRDHTERTVVATDEHIVPSIRKSLRAQISFEKLFSRNCAKFSRLTVRNHSWGIIYPGRLCEFVVAIGALAKQLSERRHPTTRLSIDPCTASHVREEKGSCLET